MYDGISNMMGKHSAASTKISEEQPKAIETHCQSHSLSLVVKSLAKECHILRDTMGTVGEICVLVKYSPKREKMLGKLTENVEGTFDPDEQQATKLDKLCFTMRTVRANCLQLRAFAEVIKAVSYMHTPITFPKPDNRKICLQSKGHHWQISPYKLWKTYLMIVTTTFSTKVLKNQLVKSRLSQNRPYHENETRQITVFFSLSKAANLKNFIIQKLHTHVSGQSTTKQLIPLSIRFRTGLSSLDSKYLARLNSQLFPAVFDDCKPVNFGNIVKGIQLLSREKCKLIRYVVFDSETGFN